MSDECTFCKIINKQLPADIVYEDELVIAFHDINPQTPAHLLIVPKVHIPSLNELAPEHSAVLGHIPFVAMNIAKEMGLVECGWRLVANCGEDAKQTVFHLHIHMLGGRPMNGNMA